MKKRQLLERIEELEARVKLLEARQPEPYPVPYQPILPHVWRPPIIVTCGVTQ